MLVSACQATGFEKARPAHGTAQLRRRIRLWVEHIAGRMRARQRMRFPTLQRLYGGLGSTQFTVTTARVRLCVRSVARERSVLRRLARNTRAVAITSSPPIPVGLIRRKK